MAGQRPEFIAESVLHHFPARTDEVRALAGKDHDFLEMCEELAAAEEALARMDSVPLNIRAERMEECRGWIERLTREMEQALAKAKVIPLSPPKPGRWH